MSDFNRLSRLIHEQYGIKMPPAKKIMLESRLQKRLKALNMTSYREYCELIFSPQGAGSELIQMIDVVTTNKTDFFRESAHFDFMLKAILPEWMTRHAGKPLRAWSAGCASGEEPYTLAMVLSEFAREHPAFGFSILATDISTQVLEKALMAIYPQERIEHIPLLLKKKYFARSKDSYKKTVRVLPELRAKVVFQRLNLMDQVYQVQELFDVILCRNVLIYFDRSTQEQVINKLAARLRPGGYFFLGHSESIIDLDVPLVQIKPTIFKKTS